MTSSITGDGSYSFAFSTTSSTNISFSSREGANVPELVIVTADGATHTPTATATAGPSPTPTVTGTATPTTTATSSTPPTVIPTTPPPFQSATFLYDGDGKRVKSIVNGTTTTFFVGNYYERVGITTASITKYYYAGSQRIAMRTNGTLQFLLGDHLGSTSLTTDAAGNKVSELRYKAWGEVRYASGDMPTKYQYTGQFSYESEFGLYFYNARWYDSSLGRFAQVDTIVPEQTQGVQAWDRYAYSNNNPVQYVDPTGHDAVPPAGNQIQVNIGLGLNVGPLFLVYYSLSLVTDYKGGVQVYFTKRDQDFNEGVGFQSGPAESENPTEMLAIGGTSVTWGAIEGSDFRNRGTNAYEGYAVAKSLSVGSFTSDTYVYADPATGEIDPAMLTGYDVGFSFGGPLTYGTVSTSSIALTDRIQLPDWAVPLCKLAGQCGSGTPLSNPFMQPPTVPQNLPETDLPVITPFKEYPRRHRWREILEY